MWGGQGVVDVRHGCAFFRDAAAQAPPLALPACAAVRTSSAAICGAAAGCGRPLALRTRCVTPSYPPLQLAPLCDIPTGRRYFPTTIAVDNLTACSSSGNHAGSWSTRWGELVLAEPPTWVDNQDGAR